MHSNTIRCVIAGVLAAVMADQLRGNEVSKQVFKS